VPEPGTLRLLPPLTVDSDQIERAVATIAAALLSYAPQ
jgi:4-aminobutyrate aminotransferase-like enzyme